MENMKNVKSVEELLKLQTKWHKELLELQFALTSINETIARKRTEEQTK